MVSTINLQSYGSSTDTHYNSESTLNENYSFQVYPSYNRYHEGEKMIYSFFTNIHFNYTYGKNKNKTSDVISLSKQSLTSVRLNFGNNINKYFSDTYYIHCGSSNFFQYDDNIYQDKRIRISDAVEEKQHDRSVIHQYNFQLNLGLGLGRVRNINPIIRALRFNERLALLTGKYDLGETAIMKLSELYAKSSGFSEIYDRPQKYFYSCLPDSVKNTIEVLSPWQFLYLTEVTQEIIGDRFEGFDSNIGLIVEYRKILPQQNFYNNEHFFSGIYLNGTYYHNPSLNYQIGVLLNGSYRKSLNLNSLTHYIGNILFQIKNLWNVVDRILLEFNLGTESLFGENRYSEANSDKQWAIMHRYLADISCHYFMENNLSIYSNLGFAYQQNRPPDLLIFTDADSYIHWNYKDRRYWHFSIGMNYYLDRNLR